MNLTGIHINLKVMSLDEFERDADELKGASLYEFKGEPCEFERHEFVWV